MATSTTSRVATSEASKKGKSRGGDGGTDAAAGGKKKKSKKKMIIIAVVALLVIGVGLKETVLKPKAKPMTAAQLAAKKAATPPVYGPIVPLAEQTLNLTDGHFLKLQVVIQLKKDAKYTAPETDGTTTAELSAAAQAVLSTYSGYSQAQLTGVAAQDKAKAALVTALNPIFPDEISGVYEPEFLMSS